LQAQLPFHQLERHPAERIPCPYLRIQKTDIGDEVAEIADEKLQ
jgi:hypothetical protein